MDNHDNCWRFGFEHECLAEILHVRCFVVNTSKDHYIGCLYIRSPKPNPRYTIIFSHPNGSDISDHLSGVPRLHETAEYLNCNIVTYDYSGYGISTGRPNERAVFSDIEAVFEHLMNVENVPEPNIILWGTSIGTAVTVHLATKTENIAGVMLFAPPTSMMRALCWKRCCCCQKNQPCKSPKRKCRMDKFDTLSKIHKIQVPLLIVHGIEDELVPIDHGQALYEASSTQNTPLWVPGVGHNNLENSELLWQRVLDFINKEARPPEPTTAKEFDDREMKKLRKRKNKSRRRRKSTGDLGKERDAREKSKKSVAKRVENGEVSL